jgi:hypothetical protein
MKNEIKIFLIKLVAIVFAIILIINSTYNLIFAEKIEFLSRIINFKDSKKEITNKIREELKRSLKKEKLFYGEDRELIKQLYQKIKNEFDSEK